MNDRDQVILHKEYRAKNVPSWLDVLAVEEQINKNIIDTNDGNLARRGKLPAKIVGFNKRMR